MTKSNINSRHCDRHSVRPMKHPTGTVIPEFLEQQSTFLLSKCPGITTAHQKEREVFEVFSQTLQLYKPEEIMFSFNGGKDCTVVLHMLHKFYQNNALKHIKLPVLYIQSDDNFPELDLFVDECSEFYNINLIKRKGDIKSVLFELLKEMPGIKAVFMGNRRTDPYCKELKLMQPTDSGWPPLMRINPIIDWSYGDIWTYIFVFKVPYCILYEWGYTSIGNRKNTIPNPHLRIMGSSSACSENYHPAYMLEDGSQERAGRIKTQKEEK